MYSFRRPMLIGAVTAALAVASASGPVLATPPVSTTTADLFGWPAPYALGHRGYGANRGEDVLRPIENTLDGFHRAFRDGIHVVELDLQVTSDRKVVVFHDDFLADGTCVRALTYDELLAREPQVPLFRAVLASNAHFSRGGAPSGLFLAEIKVPVPHCDDARTSELAETSESALVAAVVANIRQARMEGQVVINAGSPSILRHAYQQAPDIPRALSLNVLQLLDPAVVGQVTGLPVTQIARNDCGLPWYEVGGVARLPSYYCTSNPACAFQSFVATTLGCAHATAVSVDKTVLLQAGAGAATLVAAMHQAGLEVIVWTVDSADEWDRIAATGVDGITTNSVAMGLARQAAVPAPGAAETIAAMGAAARDLDRSGDRPGTESSPVIALLGIRPAKGAVLVDWSLTPDTDARLELLDVTGRRLDARDLHANGAARAESTLGDGLPNGVYFVRLTGKDRQAVSKAVLVR